MMRILKRPINTIAFINAVKNCSGDVFLQTKEGDRLNLKSSLCQYIFAFASVSDNTEDFLINAELTCAAKEDYRLLSDYYMVVENEYD